MLPQRKSCPKAASQFKPHDRGSGGHQCGLGLSSEAKGSIDGRLYWFGVSIGTKDDSPPRALPLAVSAGVGVAEFLIVIDASYVVFELGVTSSAFASAGDLASLRLFAIRRTTVLEICCMLAAAFCASPGRTRATLRLRINDVQQWQRRDSRNDHDLKHLPLPL